MDGPPPAGAYATVNPNRADDGSGLTLLSAAGVVFMAIVALNRALRARGFFANRKEPDLREFLDLTALGLVCDVMPMTGLARVLTAQGLKVLTGDGNPGLKALARKAGMKGAATAFDLGFLLGPRINAAGRIGHARLAFDLLTTDDAALRETLAEKLHVMNAERQAIERAVQQEAIELVERRRLHERAVIVAAGEGWHPGVVGIVAARLKEAANRPAVVIGFDGDIGKGSARSVAGVDLGAAVQCLAAEGLVVSGGGHRMAAGLSLTRAQLAPAMVRLSDLLARQGAGDAPPRDLALDGLLALSALTPALCERIEAAGPFGQGAPAPRFACADVTVQARRVGEAHLKATLRDATGTAVEAMAFNAAGGRLGLLMEAPAQARFHVAGRLSLSTWGGRSKAELMLEDAARAS